MIQMPEASAIIHAWLVDISNVHHVEGEEIFDNLKSRISEAKVVWEQAARELSGELRQQQRMLSQNVKYQTICALESTSHELFRMWANEYKVIMVEEVDDGHG